jgi:hypothetical protein
VAMKVAGVRHSLPDPSSKVLGKRKAIDSDAEASSSKKRCTHLHGSAEIRHLPSLPHCCLPATDPASSGPPSEVSGIQTPAVLSAANSGTFLSVVSTDYGTASQLDTNSVNATPGDRSSDLAARTSSNFSFDVGNSKTIDLTDEQLD